MQRCIRTVGWWTVANDAHRDRARVLEASRHFESDDLQRELEQRSVRVVLVREQLQRRSFVDRQRHVFDADDDRSRVRRRRQDANERVGRPEMRRHGCRVAKDANETSNEIFAEHGNFDAAMNGSFARDQSANLWALRRSNEGRLEHAVQVTCSQD